MLDSGKLQERGDGLSNRQPFAYLLNAGTIDRPRLLSRSPVYTHKKLTLLEAPAGFGKAVLMAQWAEDASFKGYAVTWYKISTEDNSRPVFFSNLFNLLKAYLPSGTGMKNTRDTVDKFRELSGRLSRKHIIFVDHLECLSDRDSLTALNNLIEFSGLSVFFVLTSSRGNIIPVSAYRAHNQLTHIDANSLAFSDGEISALFQTRLEALEREQLMRLTGGWPVSLWYERCRFDNNNSQLNLPVDTDAVQLSPDLEEFINEQIFAGLGPDLCDALVSLSIFRIFSVKQARFVCDMKDVESLLMKQHLAPLVYTLEDMAGYFRFNPLFHQFLRKKMLERDETSLKRLHERATDWQAGQGATFEAIYHAAEADDKDRMKELFISSGGVEIGLREGIEALEKIVSLFPLEIAEKEPQLLLSRVLIYMKDGKLDMGHSLLERAIQRIAAQTDDPSLEYYRSIVVMLMAVYEDKQVSPAEIEKYENQAKHMMLGRFWSQGWFNNLLCMMYYAIGDMAKAREAATISLEFYNLSDAAYSQVFMHVHLALIHNVTGELVLSRKELDIARELCLKYFADDAGLTAIVQVLLAELNYEQGHEEAARQLIPASLEKIETHEGWVEVFIRGYVTASSLEYESGSRERAFMLLDRGRALAQQRNLPRLERITEIQKLDLLTLSGDMPEARTRIERLALGKYLTEPDDFEAASFQEAYRTVHALARYCIKQGKAEIALRLLDRTLDTQKQKKHNSFYLKSAILQILALDNLQQHDAADELFRDMLSKSYTHEFRQSFLSEGKLLRTFVSGHIKRITLSQLSTEAVSFIGTLMADGEAVAGTTEPANVLTPKEFEVLQNLSSGQSNKVIANAMNLSETTVKFHMRNIFSKLGVQNRMIAVEVARAKNIL
ncbi:LuxR C-terminal-related transcriptional regulator [Emcibacter sp.]|uniref:LuxR C-terminal-related transcriptional regulator n=1 Tax=Emcibacter sp. TaxID=1979954 RepID=UPI002AA7BE1F|nr:LuxR C-terminal-related transcriptional regulator [Emcibacter sp.]